MKVAWRNDILTITSDRLPCDKIEVLYLEAFCKRGSTHRAWEETIIPFHTDLIDAPPDGRSLWLRSIVDDKVEVRHRIRAGSDEIAFQLELHNRVNEQVDIEWAQPCVRVGEFTGRGQDDYFEKCLIFTDAGLMRIHETHRATNARYTPGQVYVPEGIDLNDVNPRPISRTRPANGLVGCFSRDDSMILATAWDQTHELFQGIATCIHSDFHIGGIQPRESKHLHGKIYLLDNDVETLLYRYKTDFEA
jgi:hypothetical protein